MASQATVLVTMSNKWWRFVQLGCVAGSLALAACSTAKPIYLSSGTQGYLVTCKGFLNDWESCLVKAGRTCGANGYDVSRHEEYDRTLIVSCKTAQH